MGYNTDGMMLRVQRIRKIALEHYEPGRRDRSYKAVWENHVRREYGICYRTFLRYMEIVPGKAAGRPSGIRAAEERRKNEGAEEERRKNEGPADERLNEGGGAASALPGGQSGKTGPASPIRNKIRTFGTLIRKLLFTRRKAYRRRVRRDRPPRRFRAFRSVTKAASGTGGRNNQPKPK